MRIAKTRVDDGLPVDQCAVLLEVGLLDGGEPSVGGVEIDRLIEELHQSVRAVEQRLGPGDPAAGQHRRVHRAHAGDGRRDALPVRNRLGVHGGQGHVVGRGGRDGVSGVFGVQPEQFRRPRGDRHRQLQCVIEPARHDGNLCAEPALDLVGDREGQQEIGSAGVDVLGYGQNRTEVVSGVAQAAHRQIGVEQIGIAHQHRIEERRLIHRGPPTADECRRGGAAELARCVPGSSR